MIPPVPLANAGPRDNLFTDGKPPFTLVHQSLHSGQTNNLDPIASQEKEEYPDGGLRAWLVVLGAWCAMVPSMGLLNTMAILQAWLMEHDLKGVPESTVGWIFSCYAFFLYFCGAQVGTYTPLQSSLTRVLRKSEACISTLV